MLGKDAEAAQVRQAGRRHQGRVQPGTSSHADGRIKGDTQAGYALALAFDLLPEDLRAGRGRAHGRAASTRTRTTSRPASTRTIRMMMELTRAGYTDVAYG